jgi:15-cis-phytoene synthase
MTCSWLRPGDPAMTLAACAEIVAKGDPDRFRAVMSVPLPARECLLPLFAFNVEVARAPWVTEEPLIAEMRLQWWRDALDEIAAGGAVRRHDVVDPLTKLIQSAGVPVDVLHAMIDARRWDIAKQPFDDQAAFDAHINATSGGLVWATATALGAPDTLEPACRDAGFAIGVANWLLAIPALEQAGRFPLPDGRAEAVQAVAGRALDRLRTARRSDFGAATPALRAGWQARAVLKRAQRNPALVGDGRLALGPIAKSALLMGKTLVGGW